MGQGIWTSLPMLIAEELDAVGQDQGRAREGRTGVRAYAVGLQMTGGSTTTLSEFDRYRQAGATARALWCRHGPTLRSENPPTVAPRTA